MCRTKKKQENSNFLAYTLTYRILSLTYDKGDNMDLFMIEFI